MSTGISSGSVRSDSSAPERRIPSVSAAPIEPIRLSATVPTATEAMIPGMAAPGAPSATPASGAISASGSPVSSQCAAVFAAQQPGQRAARQRVLLERPVLRIVAKEQLEREKRGQQRGRPDHPCRHRPQARQLRADPERKERRHDGEERERLHQLAALAERELQIARQHQACGSQRRHGSRALRRA